MGTLSFDVISIANFSTICTHMVLLLDYSFWIHSHLNFQNAYQSVKVKLVATKVMSVNQVHQQLQRQTRREVHWIKRRRHSCPAQHEEKLEIEVFRIKVQLWKKLADKKLYSNKQSNVYKKDQSWTKKRKKHTSKWATGWTDGRTEDSK